MAERRDPWGETLAEITGRAKHDRSWEREQRAAPEVCQVSYRRIPRSVRDKIKDIAGGHHVTVDQVARQLLEYALEQYDAGNVPEIIRKEKDLSGPD